MNDPLVSPIRSSAVLAKFPPTLLVTSTRDPALSPAVYTHTQLVKLGVDTELHIWEGVLHGFFTTELARPVKHDGGLYKRDGSKVWWMRYRDKDGIRRRESTYFEDWGEAQKCLRERLQARDNNTLPAWRRGQDLTFGEWADFYLENFSTPPFRAPWGQPARAETPENHVREH